jgi:flavin reductase (DIM6/NTAB) family NADH-FMN oxidoreductase RutF
MSLTVRAADADVFKSALGRFASSVNVITVRDEKGVPAGMTATAFCSVSMDPLLVLICVNRSARSHEQILKGGSFGVNVLSEHSVHVSSFCARPGSDKTLPAEWLLPAIPAASAPALEGSIAFLDCEVYRHFPAGTHGVIVGRVCAIAVDDDPVVGPARPLLYYQGNYHGVTELSLDQLIH